MEQDLFVCLVHGNKEVNLNLGRYSICAKVTYSKFRLKISGVYMLIANFSWDDTDEVDIHPLPLRGQQLAFRHHEVYITYSIFRRFINADAAVHLETIDGISYNLESWITLDVTGGIRVSCDEGVTLAGHSFGGCTVVSPTQFVANSSFFYSFVYSCRCFQRSL